MPTYKLKHATVEAVKFTPELADKARAQVEAKESTEPFTVHDGGGFSVDCGSLKRVTFGDYVLLDEAGKCVDVVSGAEFDARHEAHEAVVEAPAADPEVTIEDEPDQGIQADESDVHAAHGSTDGDSQSTNTQEPPTA